MRTTSLGAAVALTLGLIAGCSSSATQLASPADPAATSSPEPAAVDPDPAGARATLERALDTMIEDDAWKFAVDAKLAGTTVFTIDGEASNYGGWRATTRMITPEPATNEPTEFVFDAVSQNGKVWMQGRKWPAIREGCWLSMTSTQVPLGFTALVPDQPGYISALGDLTSSGYLDAAHSKVLAKLPFDSALYLLNGQTIIKLGLDKAPVAEKVGDFSLPVVVEIVDDRVASIAMSGEDIARVAREAGANVTDQIERFLGAYDISIGYESSPKIRVQAPDPDLQMTTAERSCR